MTLTVFDKSTHEELGSVREDDPTTTADAVGAVAEAFRRGPWRRDARLRQSVLAAWADALARHTDELVGLLLRETGKVRAECERELDFTVDALRFNAGMARLVSGSSHELSDGSAGHLIREPAGPAAFVVPWNWPLFLLFRDLAPALAAGVTAVLKPAPLTPLATARALELLPAEAPEDVVRMVVGGAEVGRALSEDPRIRVVAFTGSTAVGRQVATSAVARFAKPVLELGGKGASVVLDDADVPAAVSACVANAFVTAGQMCMANSRILVQRPLYQRVLDAVCERVEALRVGHPDAPGTDLGALISAEQAERVSGYLELAASDGSLRLGGGRVRCDGLAGAFLRPAVIAGERVHPRLRREEIFGPVVTVEAFDRDEDGVALANETEYGLAAAVWTGRHDRAWRAARELEFGTVWVNRYNRTFAEVPSGGAKHSGMGRTRGFEGVHEFTELKHVNWGID
ncbi:aldehyde dehydrogenase [Streptomyces sp. NBRC 109706]|uniref:aldehyde dehydrogenase family protein n=1 Tax=Streptomyces sp. NBRC 109706 TaxID=1550035 RepID=UPI00078504F7|nr:aldehyde dehydrogenase family protein [Streptomyces sp. NBRC 109706]